MRTRQRENNPEEAKSNLTSFLDLIFNIMAFFVMTFSPPSLEKNFDVRLPTPKIDTPDPAAKEPVEGFIPEDEPDIFKNMKITLTANPEGSLGGIQIENRSIPNLVRLTSELKFLTESIGADRGNAVDAAVIVASPTLKYEHVLAAVDACHRANISQIGFSRPTR